MVLGKQKKPKRNKVRMDEEDKISKLPDALVYHIYSFLPTKSVLSTCILSKRWKDLSFSAPILDFRNWRSLPVKDYALAVQKIMNTLDTVLFVHEKPKIQKFLVSVDDCFDTTRVNRWIGTVIKRKVEELVLCFSFGKPFIFPLSFFTCDSLIVLELSYSNTLNLPNTISFPRLKSLRLACIIFEDENMTGKLISSCPILEELRLINCHFGTLEVLYIKSCTLKHLSIREGYFIDSTLKIVAPNLLTIKYAAELPADFVLDSFPSLVEAVIDIDVSNTQHDARMYAPLAKLYHKLSNVKILKTSGDFYQGLSEANILLAELPAFCNLVRLEISSPFSGVVSGVSSVRILLWFLQLSPSLESIVFTEGVLGDLEDDNWTVNSMPQYSLSNLKSVVLRHFVGHKGELGVVKFFLANAGALQTMTIAASRHISEDYEKQMQVASELLKFPRSSSSCVLEFLTPKWC